MKDKTQFYIDMAILIVIGIAIWYLRSHSTAADIGPADTVMSFLGQ